MKKEELRKKINSIGVIEYRIYGDTSCIYIMQAQEKSGRDEKCLASYEFSDLDFEKALNVIYKKAIEKGLFDE